ncbi:2-oxo acid dehydrogenase subunit E2 [Rubrivirga sp. IMCC43871]|uniref:2-oxo acid dehydrogenase subunit E2 n=1 Tax=Rubrivirga sp. IMCC43871 TaxID=3391575 RepID=UPI003990371E
MLPFTTVPHTRLQALNARVMHQAIQETAQATLHVDADAGPLVAFLDHASQLGREVTVEAVVARALVEALRAHPHINARVGVEGLTVYHAINLGRMVALDRGVIVPVVSSAQAMSLDELGAALRTAVEKTEAGELSPNDARRATVTIASFTEYAVDHFTPILVSGMVATLGVGRLRTVCEPVDGRCVPGHRLALSLTFDHRAVHGVDAARFVTTLAERLADPHGLA